MYRITDSWTTRDGEWEPSEKPYSIDFEHSREYSLWKASLGGATHIYVQVIGGPSNKLHFFTRDRGISEVREENSISGWANLPLTGSSAYNPDRGEVGWWSVEVADAPSEVADGLGLPFSWHVSNFVVFQWQESGVEQPDEGPQTPEQTDIVATIVLYKDGTYEIAKVNW